MKSYSNTYIFSFASIMVIVVAAVLSIAAMLLQPMQKRNIEVNKKQNILAALNITSTADNAEDYFDKYISKTYVVDIKGQVKEGVDAFTVDMKKELGKPAEEMNLPIFQADIEGNTKYILPLRGKGLWGPIWGFVALDSDYTTVYGANFDHKSETPGLGAEISTQWFQKQFIGKKIFDNEGNFVSVAVMKGGTADPNSAYQVDGVSGGTITSKGLDEMLKSGLGNYLTYIKNQKK